MPDATCACQCQCHYMRMPGKNTVIIDSTRFLIILGHPIMNVSCWFVEYSCTGIFLSWNQRPGVRRMRSSSQILSWSWFHRQVSSAIRLHWWLLLLGKLPFGRRKRKLCSNWKLYMLWWVIQEGLQGKWEDHAWLWRLVCANAQLCSYTFWFGRYTCFR